MRSRRNGSRSSPGSSTPARGSRSCRSPAGRRCAGQTGRSLADDAPALLPAQLVYLAWDELADGEASIVHATSSGLACGASYAEAALSALLELVERDAFMLVWRNRLSLPRIDPHAAHGVVAWERRYLDGARLRRRVVDLSCVHGLPTLLAVVEDGAGSLGVGAAAAASPEAAYRKALAEAYATQGAARRMREDGTSRRAHFEEIATFADHIAVYADPRNAVRAAFLTASPDRVQLDLLPAMAPAPPEEQLEFVARALLDAGVESYAVDVTTPDIADLGLCVVRAVAPELCMLDVRQDACFLGGPRLRRAPVDLRLRGRELAFHELNLDPAPVPVSAPDGRARLASSVYRGEPRRDDPAELFHEASKLTPATVAHSLAGAAALAASPALRRTVAASSLRHPELPLLPLPAAAPLDTPLGTAIETRRSARTFGALPIERPALAALLQACYGVTGELTDGDDGLQPLRAAPSGGALYPLDVYVAAARVVGLPPGLYRYEPLAAGLEAIGPPAALGEATANPELADAAAVTVVFAATFWRSRFKYGQRAYRFALLEAGHAAQNLLLAANALDLAAVPLGGFFDHRLDAVLALDGVDRSSLYVVCVGARPGAS